MKKFFLLMLMFFSFSCSVRANELSATELIEQALVTPQNIDFARCTKVFDFPVEKLFYISILAIHANKFEIEELQSKMGYILFNAANKSFLMSVIKIDGEHSMLKITPADNVYFFPYGVVYNIYKYIDLNADEQLKTMEVFGNNPIQNVVIPVADPVNSSASMQVVTP